MIDFAQKGLGFGRTWIGKQKEPVLDVPVELFQGLDHEAGLDALGVLRIGFTGAHLLGRLKHHQPELGGIHFNQANAADAVGQMAGVFLDAVELFAIQMSADDGGQGNGFAFRRGRVAPARAVHAREFFGGQIDALIGWRGRRSLRALGTVVLPVPEAAEKQMADLSETSLLLRRLIGHCRGSLSFVPGPWSLVIREGRGTNDKGRIHFTSMMLFNSPNWLASTYLLCGSVTHSPSTMKR